MKPLSPIRGPVWAPLLPLAAFTAHLSADTIAYWRFEGEGETLPTNGAYVQDTNGRTAIQSAGIPVPDLSGNGNRLFTWNDDGSGHLHRPTTSSSPFSIVPRTGQPNGWFIENSGGSPASFTWSSQSAPTGVNLDTWTSATWTIEASCYTDVASGWRTVVGRDGNDVRTGEAGLAPLYFQKMDAGTFRIAYVDALGNLHQAVDTTVMSVGQWYHFAATCDGLTLKLYKKTGMSGEYVLVASSDVSWSENPAMINPGNDATGQPWGWSVGRGRYGTSDNPNDNHVDRWDGGIDEVRISNVALEPADFLATPTAGDSDNDGLPDWWEILHFRESEEETDEVILAKHTGTTDADGDTHNNAAEFAAGSDPNNPDSVPGDIDGDGLDDEWETLHFNGLAQGPNGDPDGDFANNLMEFQADTNPTDPTSWPDNDNGGAGDGLNDGWELAFFGDLDEGPDDDPDNDGFTNQEEYDAGTDPTNGAFSPMWSSLRHRWSFNGTLEDLAGDSDATIVDVGVNDATLGDTAVTLTGGAKADSDYVLLGNNLLQGRTTPVTIQLWATQNAIQNWSRIFDFHSSTGEYLMMSWTQGTNEATDRVEWIDSGTANTANNTNQPYTVGVEYHIVMTVEPLMGPGGTTRVTWYRAPSDAAELGGARGTFNTANKLANLNDALNALGLSPWNDNVPSASYNEVRIWDGALSASSRELLHTQGADQPLVADTDGDRLPDVWEIANGLDETSAEGDDGFLGDPDNDGFSNRDEYLAGSNPTSAASTPEDVDGDGLPDDWERDFFGNILQGPGDDPDGDFATNLEEYEAFTNPNSGVSAPDVDGPDNFGDGMGDAWELHYFGTTDRDGFGDFDEDGISDYEEFINGTDPTDPASPGNASGDVDGDGLDDRWEVANFGSITAQGAAGDPDEDGYSNLQEYRAGSDPNDEVSTPVDVNGDGLEDTVQVFDFTTLGGGILDKDGEGTGMTQRLANTGTDASYLPNDPNLDIDTEAGLLTITSTTNDVNGQVGMDVAEMIGIPLSSLGFTGTQDFRIRAKFVDMPFGGGFDQIGVFAGASSTAVIRGGRIAANQALGVNTNGNNDSAANFAGAHASLAETLSMTVELSRVAGVWSLTVNGVNATPGAQPAFLNGLADLTVGVFNLDGGSGGAHKDAKLDSMTVIRFGQESTDADNDGMNDAWETANGLNPALDDSLGDLDGDGVDNLTEFAFNGKANDGSDNGHRVLSIADTNSNGQRELLLTIAVRTGATFAAGPGGSQVATVEGITYTVRGSQDLASFESEVVHVSKTASDDPAWELHTFRLSSSEGLTGKGFLQAGAAKATP